MKPPEIEPIPEGFASRVQSSDRLTQTLIWLVFFLVAGLAGLAADLWFWPEGEPPAVQAEGSSSGVVPTTPLAPAPSLTAKPWPTATTTVAAGLPISFTGTVTETMEPPPGSEEIAGSETPPPCVPPDDWGIHVVQDGNTLYSLAERYGTDVDTLMRVNCLNTFTIFIDQRLYVPGLGAPTVSAATRIGGATAPIPNPGAASATPRPEMLPLLTAAAAELPQPTATPAPTLTPRPALPFTFPDHYINILLLGSDKRPTSGAWRTDSMIIVSVDTQVNVVRLLSIPRDLWVYIPSHGYNRVNTADLWGELDKKGGGPERVKRTIHYNLGIPIHYYVRVDFQGFIKIVDAVGGVDIDVECPLSDINLSAGMHHMDGRDALRYARSRKSTNDFDRGRRQRKVLMALWDQALSLDIIPKLPELWRAMSSTFETDMTLDQVINLAYVGVRLKPQRILSRAIGPRQVQSWVTPQGAAVLLPREDRIRDLLESFYAPVDIDRLDAKDKVQVQVLNGGGRRQAEELAAAALRWEGFKVISAGLADNQDQALTSILVYTGNLEAAGQLAAALGVPASSIQDMTNTQQLDPARPVDILVILGRNYNPCQR